MFDLLFGWRKASSCKKLIRRVQCRLKLLKNKRSCIVKQLREDVALLLKNGHQQTAFQRVEQVVLDDNMVQIYDLLYHYCEFVIINFPYIRKHRDCPNDISEAISTLIFSSARFGELPELLSIRELFGQRYGRKFMLAALQLLPGDLLKHQIVENLDMKKVPDNVKHRFLDEIARSCIQTGPLLLEYKPELKEDQNDSKILVGEGKKESRLGLDKGNELEYSSENSAKLVEEVIYLDDIEEFVSPVIKDQRLFSFKSIGKTEYGIDTHAEELKESASRSSRKPWRKRSRRRSLVQESLNAAYYGESDSSPEIRRKSYHKRERGAAVVQQGGRDEEKCMTIARAMPCYLCTEEGNKAVEVEAEKQSSSLRAMSMPCERPKDSMNRSNSFPLSLSHSYSPCRHIHPKLPDYDELAAKFMELKRENLQKSLASSSG